MFCTKVLFGIDIKMYEWLKKCRDVPDWSAIDDKLICGDINMAQIISRDFDKCLPPSFLAVTPEIGTTAGGIKK